MVGERLAAPRGARAARTAIGRQCSSIDARRIAVDVVALEVLGPQAQPRRAGERRVAGDDVDLGVVEQACSLRLAEPIASQRVVDDADLGVHVQRARSARRVRDRIVVARKRLRAVVGVDEAAEHPARVVLAVVGLVRQQDDDAEVVAAAGCAACVSRMWTISGDHRNWFSR